MYEGSRHDQVRWKYYSTFDKYCGTESLHIPILYYSKNDMDAIEEPFLVAREPSEQFFIFKYLVHWKVSMAVEAHSHKEL